MAQTRMLVVAVKPFAYRGCPVVPADVCVVEPIEAAALVYRGDAKWPEDTHLGVYHRRDLVPDDVAPASRRRTRRRDMTAEA